ncbi:hypothetical protein [uncultured Muribaculum sp.]|uniref:hypothetical protein n=1 Tax=uncultured Muribaculum sp. TaxID=1918613 RepID=UPI0025B22CF1|nr:hypothetical protein [uncultured Muribaculum sp.]
MTAKEYIERMCDINERRDALNKERMAVMKEYTESLPFKVNDYVCIADNNYSTEEVWIAGIKACEFGSDRVTLYVNRHRKDGSRSRTEMAYYGIKIKDVRVINDKLNEQ